MRQLVESLETIGLTGAVDALAATGCEPVTASELPVMLTRLAWTNGPLYLPFAAWDGSLFSVYVRPAVPLLDSPVVYCDHDTQEARFICGSVRDFPRGLWLWNIQWYDDEEVFPGFVEGVRNLVPMIPGARDLPPEFLPFTYVNISRWSAEPKVDRLWRIGDVGHPMAGVPVVTDDMDPADAAMRLDGFLRAKEVDFPELLAYRIGLDRHQGAPVAVADCIRVLRAESWHQSSWRVNAAWFRMLDPMAAWHHTLARTLRGQLEGLAQTPFAPLATHPETYGGTDNLGPALLREVADAFKRAGETVDALHQLRNAALVAALTQEHASRVLLTEIAELCDVIEPNGLATALTIAYADAVTRSP